MSTEDVVNALQDLADVLQTQRTLGTALAAIAEAAVVSVPHCDAASIALSVEGQPATAAVSARVALELDLVQYDLDDGPCLTSFRNMETLRLDLVEAGDAFPHFSVAARKRGVVGVLSVPATWGNDLVATLNLYSRSRPFDDDDAVTAKILAAEIAIAVSRSPEFASARAMVEQAQRDVDDRSDLDVAAGLLMATQGCSAEQAAGLLREAAVGQEETILAIAHRIIGHHNRPR